MLTQFKTILKGLLVLSRAVVHGLADRALQFDECFLRHIS